jgi:uncharacterized hydrophobic protein (TIGR00271 family)
MDFNATGPISRRSRVVFFFRRLVKPVSLERRGEVQVQLRQSSHPDFAFFLLVVLSSVIATLGLVADSPAVIIGAMLVAPLMSPIIGLGLASITGDARLFRDAIVGLLEGALLAVVISTLLAMVNRSLPFVPLQELPTEVLARTHPNPNDLLVALAGGMAASYALALPQLSAALPGVAIATALMPPLCTVGIGLALGRGDVAGGALLLFVTNAITIAFACMLIFFVLGFSPRRGAGRLPQQLVISAVLTLALLLPLSAFSIRFFQQASSNRQINEVVSAEVTKLGAELADLQTNESGAALDLVITLRTSKPLSYQDVDALQRNIAVNLQRPVAVVVNQVIASRLDPLVPPTQTPTATPVTLTPTVTPSSTATATPTATLTPSPTATPAIAKITNSGGVAVDLLQSPGGPSIGKLKPGAGITVLYATEVAQGLVWTQVEDPEGRIGWIPEIRLAIVTLTPAPSPTGTP